MLKNSEIDCRRNVLSLFERLDRKRDVVSYDQKGSQKNMVPLRGTIFTA